MKNKETMEGKLKIYRTKLLRIVDNIKLNYRWKIRMTKERYKNRKRKDGSDL
jgi:hypothetical protein